MIPDAYISSGPKPFLLSATLEGHEDWIRCLAFSLPAASSDSAGNTSLPEPLTLASGSQDGYVRLWAINPLASRGDSKDVPGDLNDDLLDAFEQSLNEVAEDEGGKQISNRMHVIAVKDPSGGTRQYTIVFDALLISHEASVTSLVWRPRARVDEIPTLLSSSVDASLILWSPTALNVTSPTQQTSLWINRHRFGDLGGGKAGGFVGCLWAKGGQEVLTWGWNGGWRRWIARSNDGGEELWSEGLAVTGHSGPVKGLAWAPGGEYFITARCVVTPTFLF